MQSQGKDQQKQNDESEDADHGYDGKMKRWFVNLSSRLPKLDGNATADPKQNGISTFVVIEKDLCLAYGKSRKKRPSPNPGRGAGFICKS